MITCTCEALFLLLNFYICCGFGKSNDSTHSSLASNQALLIVCGRKKSMVHTVCACAKKIHVAWTDVMKS